MPVRTVIQRGPKDKRSVAFSIDWPGWSRGAKTAELALETLKAYRERYRPIAALAGMAREFDAAGRIRIVEDKVGTGSTDFWGISFAPSTFEQGPMSEADLERGIALLQACWTFFDDVAERVSPEMRKGPRGGGRERDEIIRHAIRTESLDFAKQVGLRETDGAALTPAGLRQHRKAYVEAMRAYNEGRIERRMRSWTLPFLIRHSAFHTLDHAWEMEDKDLTVAAVAYDEDVADRIRELMGRTRFTEQRMFGGVAFLIGGNMAIAASGHGGLLVRVDPARSEDVVAKTGAKPMVMRGRAMTGWLRVDGNEFRTRAQLEKWVDIGTSYARSLPAKTGAARSAVKSRGTARHARQSRAATPGPIR